MKTDVTISEKKQSIIHSTLRRVLRPLVRLMLSQGINYTMILEDLKAVFVSVAEDEFKLDGRPQTNSRITLLTGVHRKDVQRIRNEEGEIPETPNSIGAQVVALWLGRDKYLDDSGNPKPLSRLARKGGELSFESLVASVSKDFRARPILDEWLRLGLISVDEKDFVHLNVKAFIPNQDLEEKLSFLAMNVHDHASAAVNNLDPQASAMMERCVYYEGLTQLNINILHELARQQGMELINLINHRAAELKAAQSPGRRESDSKTGRMNFGIYFFHEPESGKSKEK